MFRDSESQGRFSLAAEEEGVWIMSGGYPVIINSRINKFVISIC